ncbi:hypothetical protein PR202_ga06730 [Eleusine coracana subsp. coracana]|uniref:Glycosyltransferase n=1 Tax=Eleusine coracana subsp. coracana TaxID=191504 RepID=A0AAV5BVL6_ELECO|nr:hypothetical protein PR202_ga06730 [Eleusine coracana subsp. coracana]
MDDGFRGTDLDDLMRHLDTTGRVEFGRVLARQAEAGRPVACAVVNPFMPWAVDVAADAGVPSAVLWVQSCTVFSLYHHHVHGLVEFPPEDDVEARVELPGLPPLAVADVPSFLLPSNPFKLLADAIITQFRTIDKGVLGVRQLLHRAGTRRGGGAGRRDDDAAPARSSSPWARSSTWGPTSSRRQTTGGVRGDLIKAADECVEWLNAQAAVLRGAGRSLGGAGPTRGPLLPAGFLDAVAEGRGMVVPWSPQERVLAHASTACFLTHCGWNSTLETLAAGVPVVAFPQWGDQCTDAKFLVDQLRVGVRLRAKPLGRDAVSGRPWRRSWAGQEAEEMRANARRWSAAARAAVAPGGSSDKHVQAFVDEVRRRACGEETAPADEAKVSTTD